MLLVPALGVPSELMLQDTLKSALVAFGVLAAALLFFWQQRQRSAPLLWHGLVALPLLLMLYALASMAWSHTYLAAVEAVRWFVLGLLLWLGLNALRRRDHWTLLAWGIHAGALMASVWAALQFWLDFSLFPQAAAPASTFANRNFFAEYAVCALPISVYLLASRRESRWLGLLALSVAFDLVALVMTGTRSALIALLVLVPVFALILIRYRQQFGFVRWSRLNQFLIPLVLAIGVVALGSLPPKQARADADGSALQHSLMRAASMTEGTEFTEGSFSTRLLMWKATARMLHANPLTGVGAGAWEVQIPLYQRVGESMETDYYAHNEVLQLLSEYGLPLGGLSLAVLLAYLLLSAAKTWSLQGSQREEAPLRATALASLIALLTVSSAGFPLRLASTGALFALCLGWLAASDARLGFQEPFFAAPLRWRPGWSRVMLACLLCLTFLAAYVTQQAAQAERNIVSAVKLAVRAAQSKPSDPMLSASQKEQMLQDIRNGIAINPHYRKLTSTVADILAIRGDWANAVWILESVAASRPNIANVWANIALANLQLGQGDRAQEALQQLRRLQPDAPRTRSLEALVLARTGHAAQAADSYFRLGQIYADPAVNDGSRALAAFTAALRAVPAEQRDDMRKQVPEPYRAML